MAKPKRKRAKKRQAVNRAERVAATPETLAKLRPCPLQAMLRAGSLTPEQYEAALMIWDAHDALVREVKAKGSGFAERADKSHDPERVTGRDRMVALYLEWAGKIAQRYYLTADAVVGWIADDPEQPQSCLQNDNQRRMLGKACDCWIDAADEARRARRTQQHLDKSAEQVLTSCVV